MSNRGRIGGVAATTTKVVALLDAIGFATVIVETVGVGQSEFEIVDAANTTVVVLNPGWGDSVQAAKAGLLEVADIFVINKADREGANQTPGISPRRSNWARPRPGATGSAHRGHHR